MANKNYFKFATLDFEAFKDHYCLFLEKYISSMGEMMKMQRSFLEEKSEDVARLIQINNVIFPPAEEAVTQDGDDNNDPIKAPVNEFMNMPSQTVELVNEQLTSADEMLKTATQQLEALSIKSNEIMQKMHPDFNMARPPGPAEAPPRGGAQGT